MKGKPITCDPVPGIPLERLRAAIQAALLRQNAGSKGSNSSNGKSESNDALNALQHQLLMLMEARRVLVQPMRQPSDATRSRLRDLLYLDLALESAARTAVESSLAAFSAEVAAITTSLEPALLTDATWAAFTGRHQSFLFQI